MLGFDDEIPSEFDYNKSLVRFLQHGNALGEAILEVLPHEMIIFDHEKRIVRSNRKAKDYFKAKTDRLNGEVIAGLIEGFEKIDLNAVRNSTGQELSLAHSWKICHLLTLDKKNYYLAYR